MCCDHYGRMMRLRAVAIYPPATTNDFVGIESRSFGTWFSGTTLIFLWEIGADSYGSAIRGFWDGEMALNFAVF